MVIGGAGPVSIISQSIECCSTIQPLSNFHPTRNGNAYVQVLRLRGGGKKRKKKVYTKPKKIKHKHKTVKLATLKFYKVRAVWA